MMGEGDVVITGVRVLTPCGTGVKAFWNALLAGRSGIDRLSFAADTDLPVRIGAEIRDFKPSEFIAPRKRLKLMCREMQTGYAAASLAVRDAGLGNSCVDPERLGVVFGGEIYYGPIEDAAESYRAYIVDGKMQPAMWGKASTDKLHPLYMLRTLPNMCAWARQPLTPHCSTSRPPAPLAESLRRCRIGHVQAWIKDKIQPGTHVARQEDLSSPKVGMKLAQPQIAATPTF